MFVRAKWQGNMLLLVSKISDRSIHFSRRKRIETTPSCEHATRKIACEFNHKFRAIKLITRGFDFRVVVLLLLPLELPQDWELWVVGKSCSEDTTERTSWVILLFFIFSASNSHNSHLICMIFLWQYYMTIMCTCISCLLPFPAILSCQNLLQLTFTSVLYLIFVTNMFWKLELFLCDGTVAKWMFLWVTFTLRVVLYENCGNTTFFEYFATYYIKLGWFICIFYM